MIYYCFKILGISEGFLCISIDVYNTHHSHHQSYDTISPTQNTFLSTHLPLTSPIFFGQLPLFLPSLKLYFMVFVSVHLLLLFYSKANPSFPSLLHLWFFTSRFFYYTVQEHLGCFHTFTIVNSIGRNRSFRNITLIVREQNYWLGAKRVTESKLSKHMHNLKVQPIMTKKREIHWRNLANVIITQWSKLTFLVIS